MSSTDLKRVKELAYMAPIGISTYQAAQARELDQGKLILMMYSGAIRFIDRAIAAGPENRDDMSSFISRARNIVLELMASLDFESGGEMAELLLRMYRAMFTRLQEALITDDPSGLGEVRSALVELEESWRQVFTGDEYREQRRGLGRSAVA